MGWLSIICNNQETTDRVLQVATTGKLWWNTTPTAAMEVKLNLIPLHILIKRKAKAAIYSAMVGLTRSIFGDNYRKITEKINKDRALGILLTEAIITAHNFEKNFKAMLPSRENWQNHQPSFENNSFRGVWS